jgi:shikimate dehydrogenase
MSLFKLGVLGNPVAHSRSPDIHQQFAATTGISLSYEKVNVPDGTFTSVANGFLDSGFGFNVTLPCKRDAWQFVDEASERANQAEAVNTVSRTSDGKLRGDNTDGPGLVNDLVQNLGWHIKDRKILVIGAGGAVSGVLASLLAEAPGVLHVTNRTHDKAQKLEQKFAGATAIAVERLQDNYDLVINGTSAGLSQQDLEIPGSVITGNTRCYDMIYGSGTTRFNQWCQKQAECDVADGLGMLVEQAALAFMIWFGGQVNTAPDTQSVIDTIRNTID